MLARKDPAVADLYQCALRTLLDPDNTGRIFLAAHAIREMMNSLLNVKDAPSAGTERFGEQFRNFLPLWDRAQKSKCHQSGHWVGSIDNPLTKLLTRLDNLVRWWHEHRPKHRDGVVAFFRGADPAGKPLPEILENERAQRWIDLRNYFVDTAHRNRSPGDTDFQDHLRNLEQILVDNLYRSPSVDFFKY